MDEASEHEHIAPVPASAQMRLLSIRVPPAWHAELKEVADERAISLADLCRMALRSFLRGRYEH